jgi:hypothetical protein
MPYIHYIESATKRSSKMTNAIRSQVTGQFLCGFADDGITGRGKNSVPVWGAKEGAIPASVEALAKCHLAGVLAVEVVFPKAAQ